MSFRRGSDELFGLDHNKQMVANFTQAAKTLARDDRPNQIILDELGLDDDLIYDIVGDIRDQTRAMMSQIRQMFAQRRQQPNPNSGKRTPETKATETATQADRDAIAAGIEQPTDTDRDRVNTPSEERVDGLTKQYEELGQSREEAAELARSLVENDLSYQFISTQLDGYQMFRVRTPQGILQIQLNTDHPIYDLIRHIEDSMDEDVDENDPAFQATVALRLLLSSWARMEDHTHNRDERIRIQDTAINWGRQVDKVISHLRDREEW